MSVQLQITLTEGAKRLLRQMQTMPEWGVKAIAAGMDKANQVVIGRIMRNHLTGRGPFPPDQHKLGVRTNRLRSSLWASPATATATTAKATAASAIGSNVVYAAIHEFGGTIKVGERRGQVRLREDKAGNLVRQGNGNLAVFAKRKEKRARTVDYTSGPYEIQMPERSPIRTGIQENGDVYGRLISEALQGAWNAYA